MIDLCDFSSTNTIVLLVKHELHHAALILFMLHLQPDNPTAAINVMLILQIP